MKRQLPSFILLLSLLLPVDALEAQSGKHDTREDFWSRLEREIDRFIERVTREYPSREEDKDWDAADSLSTENVTVPSDVTGAAPLLPTQTLQANSTIGIGDTLQSNVSVSNGDCTLYGRVEGDVWLNGGKLFLKDGSSVGGNIRVINGVVIKEDGAFVRGYIDKRSPVMDRNRGPRTGFGIPSSLARIPWVDETADLHHVLLRYNRVEGLFLGLGSGKKLYWDGERRYSAYGSLGYGFSSHRWRGNLGITRQFPLSATENDQLMEIGIEGHSLTDSKDDWLIPLHENSLAAFLIHEDFRDYVGREGISFQTAYYLRGDPLYAEAKIAYLLDRYESLDNGTDWALFGGSKVFRRNPPIAEGRMRSLRILAGVSTAESGSGAPQGWAVHASADVADKGAFGGDFTFHRYIADVRRYQSIGEYDQLNCRLRLGTAYGSLPPQKSFELGGLSTLPAYQFKQFPGDTLGANRMILFNAELLIHGDFLGELEFWPSWLMRHLTLLFLADAGLVRNAAPSASALDGFGGIRWNEFRSDLGFGVGNRSGSFRLAVVWRTDKSEPARFIFRFSRPF